MNILNLLLSQWNLIDNEGYVLLFFRYFVSFKLILLERWHCIPGLNFVQFVCCFNGHGFQGNILLQNPLIFPDFFLSDFKAFQGWVYTYRVLLIYFLTIFPGFSIFLSWWPPSIFCYFLVFQYYYKYFLSVLKQTWSI